MNTLVERTERPRIVQPRLHLPVMRGVIERRMLVNFRCDPDVVAKLLPPPFRPKLVHDFAMAGICLVRLGNVRPGCVPAAAGITSENAAHRIAVEWEENGMTQEGVFIRRRDTSSLLNRLAGGRLFPAVAYAANFRVWESNHRFKLELRSADGVTFVRVAARVAATVTPGSVFRDLDEASQFLQAGGVGWSARPGAGEYDGVELCCDRWQMEPLMVERVESSFFSDKKLFPSGAATFDSAFLMRNIPHEWHARGRMICNGGGRHE